MSLNLHTKTAASDTTPHDPRRQGRLRVLNLIRRESQIARIDISRQTGLSPATVTAVTAELLAVGMIEPVISADSLLAGAKRGRPRETLKIRGAYKRVAGLKVATDCITVLISDFEGTALGDFEHALPATKFSGDALADQIMAAVRGACAAHGLGINDISGIGLGLAGQIDGSSGYVHWSSSLLERNVDMGAILATKAPCPVFIENDANLVAKAEQLFGEGRHFDNFLVVSIEHGIGMGIVIDGKLYRGKRGCGAEFGHTKVNTDGAECQCGQRGCLEAYAGEYALLGHANRGRSTPFTDINALSQAAADGDAAAAQTLQHAGALFAVGLANLINIFDPELLILASKNTIRHPLCDQSVLDDVARLVMHVDSPMPQICVHGWGDLMWAKGAAAYGIEQISQLSVHALGKAETKAG
ncbi:ROK family transcriptional regulator [Yoonia sp. SS1-5]|uniref:ROK family transcriptional regulator n=1 Tax=Yoonia rhodophyticola TaxID=3137370 RepID=A0AAN0NJ07_9RHOB